MSVFTVTTLTDENDGIDVGGVSLREAIEAANAAPGRDVIRFNAGLSGTISLTYGELAISDSVVIRGLGADTLTIDAGGNSRVFHIDDGSSTNDSEVTITGVTITGGYAESAGGGIYNAEALRLIDSAIAGNRSYSLNDDGYRYGGAGGGIYHHSGSLLVQNSEISGNFTASQGGGIYTLSGNVRLIDSVIIGNDSSFLTDFLTYDGSGGGIYNNAGNLLVQNSEISNNFSPKGGGINMLSGNVRLIDSVITGNLSDSDWNNEGSGGGIYNSAGSLLVKNSEISSNDTNGDGGGIYTVSGNVRIIDSDIANNFAFVYGGGIVAGANLRVINSEISDNYAHFGGGGIDAGANLRVIDSKISGNGTHPNMGRGGGIDAGANLRVINSEISGNSAAWSGGIDTGGSSNWVVGSFITRNSADYGGGGISNSGHLTIVGSTIEDNSASYWGGGGILNEGTTTVNSSTITRNSADQGGGISNEGTTIVNHSTITRNSATDEGGGVFNSGTFRAFNSTIAGNILGEGESEFRNEFYGPAGVIVAGTNDDDEIFGGNSDDILRGRNGDDILIGFDSLIGSPGADEIDTLAGGGGVDVFVLGSFFGLESKPTSIPPTGNGLSVAYSAGGDNDYALIKDFTTEDTIGLDGHAGLYQLGTASNGLPPGETISTADGELIAIVQGPGRHDLDLESGNGFEFAS